MIRLQLVQRLPGGGSTREQKYALGGAQEKRSGGGMMLGFVVC